MRLRRRSRFASLVDRQLDLFAEDDADLLAEAAAAEAAWNTAGADAAEEAYGDYQLVIDAIGDRLLEIRETYASSLEEAASREYTAEFNKTATHRFRRYATILGDLDEPAL